jgi:hypothetical protein
VAKKVHIRRSKRGEELEAIVEIQLKSEMDALSIINYCEEGLKGTSLC